VRAGGSDPIREAARILAERGNAVVLTGAGISVESGIPSFRGSQGMWAKFDPMEYATLHAFMKSPRKVWEMLTEMVSVCGGAVPNAAHRGLAALEETGIVRAVITQNVDGLHQAAGSRRVIEYHGNLDELEAVPDPGAVDAGRRSPVRLRRDPQAQRGPVRRADPVACPGRGRGGGPDVRRPRRDRHLRAGFPRLRHPADREGVGSGYRRNQPRAHTPYFNDHRHLFTVGGLGDSRVDGRPGKERIRGFPSGRRMIFFYVR
jgi:Sir2 family